MIQTERELHILFFKRVITHNGFYEKIRKCCGQGNDVNKIMELYWFYDKWFSDTYSIYNYLDCIENSIIEIKKIEIEKIDFETGLRG